MPNQENTTLVQSKIELEAEKDDSEPPMLMQYQVDQNPEEKERWEHLRSQFVEFMRISNLPGNEHGSNEGNFTLFQKSYLVPILSKRC